MDGSILGPSRRSLLKGGAAVTAGLVIGFRWDGRPRGVQAAVAATGLVPNAFVRIAPDDTVTVISKYTEMGQGVYTGVATILAEELDADFDRIRMETAPVDLKLYINPALNMQGTGGSLSMATAWQQLRNAGATARAMLVSAAAAEWGVKPESITVAKGVVPHAPSGRHAQFGELAAKAATLPMPANVQLKEPKDFTLIGQPHLPRLDTFDKTNGTA